MSAGDDEERPSRRRSTGAGLPPGTRVAGRFEVHALLGEGGMGSVYRATQLALRRPVALKLLLPHLASDELARARFEREARVASRLRHPNAVEIFDFGQGDDTLFLAMELLEGESLRAVLEVQTEVMPLQRALRIAAQVADALVAAHREPLIHRDIKPENIFLCLDRDGEERAVVVDFGLAFIADHDELGRVTRQGALYGSPAYMSPEQAREPSVEAPTDIYSLGCVLHELVTGVPPFAGGGLQVLSRHCFTLPESPRARFPELDISPALDALILRMLRKHPAARPTAEDVKRALLRLLEGQREEAERVAARAVGRAARMVPAAPPSQEPASLAAMVVRVEGVDEALLHALQANDLEPDPAAAGCVVVALGQPIERLVALAAYGPVVADADPADMSRISDLLRAGVVEVVPRPVAADELVRRVRRAARRLVR
ncbi:MAG: serine/threonine protein kinase [Myxococcales bacterium]|nr:serine/threonine protein kinase [Myxococcales bacterium]